MAEVDSPMLGARQYMAAVRSMLDRIAETQLDAIAAAADAIIRSFQQDGLLYIFGTGHSHLMAEEGHYRAGGLAPVVPMISSSLMLHEGAVVSTRLERLSGIGPAMLTRYPVTEHDTVIVYSNSGVNAAPVEAAMAAKERRMTVIAVVARAYASAAPAGATGRKLAEIADIVIDNQGVPGDALVEVQATGLRVGPASTITGAFILNSILTEVAWRLADAGGDLPIYISANMPGAVAHNAALIARFRPRNPHL